MASNRKNQSGAVRFVPAFKAVILCTLIGGSCAGYVLQKNKIYDLGQQLGARQTRLERLRKDNQDLAGRLAVLQRPIHLEKRVVELDLQLVRTTPSQMVWITEYSPGALSSNAPLVPQYVEVKRR